MKKIILSLVAQALCVLVVQSQDCTYYFPVKQGTSLEMKTYDAKDKVTGTIKQVVIGKTENSVKFNSEFLDKSGKSVSKGDYEVKCQNGEFVVDMGSFIRNMDMSGYKDMNVKVETDDMSIPANPQPGQQLKNGEVRMKVSNEVMTLLNMTIKITNRKVEGFEDITTPAGTFKCLKITYDIETKMMFTSRSKVTEWISQKVGLVKSEAYSEKNKLLSYTLLTMLKE